jgi:hypothetical protein
VELDVEKEMEHARFEETMRFSNALRAKSPRNSPLKSPIKAPMSPTSPEPDAGLIIEPLDGFEEGPKESARENLTSPLQTLTFKSL